MKSFYGRTRAEAEAKREAYKRDLEDGMEIGKDEITVSEWIDTWYAKYQKKRLNPLHEAKYYTHVKRLKKAIGEKKLKAIREADLQDELYNVANMSYSTIEKYSQVIKAVFLRAKKNKLLRDNPAEDLVIPRGVKGTHRALERWETDLILKSWHEHRAGIWAMLMLLCGLRRSEMIALRWENIDLETRRISVCEVGIVDKNQTVIVPHTKSDAGMRILPICTPLLNALKTVPEGNRTGYICLSAKGNRLSESAFDRGWDGFCLAMQRLLNGEDVKQQGRRMKLEDKIAKAKKEKREYLFFRIRAHDLRHTYATALFDADIPVKAAQYYLGHSDIRMTMDLYTHLSEERKKREQIRMTDYLDTWLTSDAKPSEVPPDVLSFDPAWSKLGQSILDDE